MNPRVSVIVPVHNAAETLRACVDALLVQDIAEEFETVFIDNGSTDASMAILGSFEPRIVTGRRRRPGPSAARNRGVEIATGTLLVFTDADCFPQPGWLRELVRAADGNPEATIVGGPILARPPHTPAARFAERLFDQERSTGAKRLPYVISANLCVRRDRFIAAGGFDESVMQGEDVDFSYRMQAAVAGPFLFAKHAVVEHANPDSLWALLRKGVQHGHSVGALAERHQELRGESAVDRLLSSKRYMKIASETAEFVAAGTRAVASKQPVAREEWLFPLYAAAFEGAKQAGVAAHVLSDVLNRTRAKANP